MYYFFSWKTSCLFDSTVFLLGLKPKQLSLLNRDVNILIVFHSYVSRTDLNCAILCGWWSGKRTVKVTRLPTACHSVAIMWLWTKEHWVFVYDTFIKCGESVVETQQCFKRYFHIKHHGEIPSRNTILRWINSDPARYACTPQNRVREAILRSRPFC